MTQIDKEDVERLGNWLALNARPEHIDAYNSLHAALDAAEARNCETDEAWAAMLIDMTRQRNEAQARERAAVAAALVTFVDLNLEMFGDKHAILDPSTLSDTDALAEYVEKVRAEEREQASQKLLAIIAKHKAMSRTKGTYPRLTEDIAAAIRQGASDD
jgi:hypothetical protein